MKTKITIMVIIILNMIVTTGFAKKPNKKITNEKPGKTKTEIYLAPDHSKISKLAITETHEPGKCITITDTIQNYYPEGRAKIYVNQKLAETLVNEGGMTWLEDSLVPRWTHIFGQDQYIPRYLQITLDRVFYEERASEYRPTDKKILWTYLLRSLVFLLIITTVLYIKNPIQRIRKNIRWFIIGTFVFCNIMAILFNEKIEFDIVFNFTIWFLPTFLATFLFQKRSRKAELKKKGYDIDYPLRVFNDGSMIVKIGARGKDGSMIVHWFDKNYKDKNVEQIYKEIHKDQNGIRMVSKWINGNQLYGIIDTNIELILPVIYSSIRDFHEKLACVQNNQSKLYAYYHEEKRDFITQFKYKEASLFIDGKALVVDQHSTQRYYIDTEGKTVPIEKLTEKEKKML
jgi:hypothetical protein